MSRKLSAVNQPLYTFAETDRIADVSRGTANRWLAGYWYRSGDDVIERPAVASESPRAIDEVSFLDLMEVVVIGKFRTLGFSLREIRDIVANCAELLRTERPLVSERFKVGGREVFVSSSNKLVEILRGKGRQAWTELLDPFLRTVDYEGKVARRWWPLGTGVPVVVDPDFASGLPVVATAGVRTEIILERFQVGDLSDVIADDFNISTDEVERALQFEISRLKAA